MNSVTGFSDFRTKLQGLINNLDSIVEDALRSEAIDIIQDAQTGPDMPVRSGDLANSGDVGPVEATGNMSWEVSFGFGGGTIKYAWMQHEGGTTPTGGQVPARKYFERPLTARTGTIATNLAAKLQARLSNP